MLSTSRCTELVRLRDSETPVNEMCIFRHALDPTAIQSFLSITIVAPYWAGVVFVSSPEDIAHPTCPAVHASILDDRSVSHRHDNPSAPLGCILARPLSLICLTDALICFYCRGFAVEPLSACLRTIPRRSGIIRCDERIC